MRRIVSLFVVSTFTLSSFASVYAQNTESPTLNAAPNNTAVAASSNAAGEYKEVACTSDPIFAQNSCNQCFTGPSVKKGGKLTGLFDNWNNTTGNMLIAVKDEQKTPNMVAVDSKWTPAAADETKMWKFSPEVVWMPTPNSGKEEFILSPNTKVRFMETEMGAGFTLDSSSRKHGEVIGLLRFPVVYYTMDSATASRSTNAETHYECVSYTLDEPTTPEKPTPNKPGKPDPKKPNPPTPDTPTKVETGPAETILLIVAAFFIAFGLMISLRKRN